MYRFLLLIGACVAGVAALLGVRTSRFVSRQPPAASMDGTVAAIDPSVERFAAALRIPTISTQDSAAWKKEPFLQFHEFLGAAYPKTHTALTREVVNGYSLLYTWRGSDTTLAPMLLMGHFDVVPVEPGTEGRWTHPPFAGEIADGYLWGRGALDDKLNVIGVLEAAEALLGAGYRPTRTILFAFGHDEELGGPAGAKFLADAIKSRYGSVSFLVDEGGAVVNGMMPGVGGPVAVVGIAEKSSGSVE